MEQISPKNIEVPSPKLHFPKSHWKRRTHSDDLLCATGFKITTSQIAASYAQDGKYVICASEDSQVYVWKREEVKNVGGKPRYVTVQAHEHFPCKDVSVAISWPGSIKNNEPAAPPLVEAASKRQQQQQEDESEQPSDTDSAAGPSESFASGSSSVKYGESPSISASSSIPSQSRSSSLNLSSSDSGNTQGGNAAAAQATAWGMVIVTASSGGELRVYQNFGLPVKANRQTNLFIA